MRVLLVAFGSRGDVQPMVALAMALQRRGHSVTVCAPPDDESWIRERGLEARAVGPPMKAFVVQSTSGLRGGLRAMTRDYPRMVAEHFHALEPHARACDVMLGSTITAAGPTFAEAFGIRYHYVSFSPCIIPSAEYPSLNIPPQTLPGWVNRLTWWMNSVANNLILRSTISFERRRFGLAPISDAWLHMLHRQLIIGSEPALAALPRDAPAGTSQTGAWLIPEHEELPPDLEGFLQAGSPPVYVGFGSMPHRDPGHTTRQVLDAVKAAGVRALISSGWAGLGEGDLPRTVRAIVTAPHGKLFPRCAAVVHHGGAGTTVTAARSGVPQIVVPHMTDQFFWRHRLLQLGLSPPQPVHRDLRTLASALRTTLDDPDLRERARAFAPSVSLDGLGRATQIVEGAPAGEAA